MGSFSRTVNMRRSVSEPNQDFSHALPPSSSQGTRTGKLPLRVPVSPTPHANGYYATAQAIAQSPASPAGTPHMHRLLDFFAVFEKFPPEARLKQVYPSDGTLKLPCRRLCAVLPHLGCDGPCSVAISDSDQWFYCSALALAQENEDDAPQVLCLVSRIPCFNFMEDALRALSSLCKVDVRHQVALEPFIRCLVFEVPSIPRDRTMRLCWERERAFRRRIKICDPRIKHLPFLDDRSFRLLFSLCGSEVIVSLLEHLLAEHSVLLHATKLQIDRLTPLAEALRALLYPLDWQGLFMPILPKNEWHVLNASPPYIAGLCCEPNDLLRLQLLKSQKERGNPIRVFVINADTGEHQIIRRGTSRAKPGLLKLPEQLRTNLLNHLDEVLILAKSSNGSVSPTPHMASSSGEYDTSSSGSNGSGSGISEDKSSPPYCYSSTEIGLKSDILQQPQVAPSFAECASSSVPSPISGASSAFSSSNSSGGEQSSDELTWVDWVRIAFLEVFLSLLSHVHYHLDSTQGPFPNKDCFRSPSPTTPPQGRALRRCQSMNSSLSPSNTSSLKSTSSRCGDRRDQPPLDVSQGATLAFDPEGFVRDMPGGWQAFVRALVSSRMFCTFVTKERSERSCAKSSNRQLRFDHLAALWRNCSLKPVKRKMTPLLKGFQTVLVDIGYSFTAARLAIDQLKVFSPEEMNLLFTSVEKIKETLNVLGVPRFVLDADCIAPTTDNTRTQKLRALLQRDRTQDRPPLVCTVSLSKQCPELQSSWVKRGHADVVAGFPLLRGHIIVEQTAATLPLAPIEVPREKASSARLSTLCLASDIGFEEANALLLGALETSVSRSVSACSALKGRCVEDELLDGEQKFGCSSQLFRALEWTNNQALQSSQDKIQSLLSHVSVLYSALESKDSRIKQLEQQLAGGDAQVQEQRRLRRAASTTCLEQRLKENMASSNCEKYPVRPSSTRSQKQQLPLRHDAGQDSLLSRRIERRLSPLFIDPARKESSLGVVFQDPQRLSTRRFSNPSLSSS